MSYDVRRNLSRMYKRLVRVEDKDKKKKENIYEEKQMDDGRTEIKKKKNQNQIEARKRMIFRAKGMR